MSLFQLLLQGFIGGHGFPGGGQGEELRVSCIFVADGGKIGLQFSQNLEELAHGGRTGHADILVLEHEYIKWICSQKKTPLGIPRGISENRNKLIVPRGGLIERFKTLYEC